MKKELFMIGLFMGWSSMGGGLLNGAETGKKEPIYIQASESIECDQRANKVRAVRNASVRKGNSTLYGDIIYGYFQKIKGKNHLSRVEAFGHVRIMMPEKVIQAHEGHYDVQADIIILKGQVRGTDKKNQLVGEYARINRKTGVTQVFAAEPSGDGTVAPSKGSTPKRVRILLNG